MVMAVLLLLAMVVVVVLPLVLVLLGMVVLVVVLLGVRVLWAQLRRVFRVGSTHAAFSCHVPRVPIDTSVALHEHAVGAQVKAITTGRASALCT